MLDQNKNQRVGTIEMSIAMLLSGSIGLFVIKSGQSPENVVFYRCLIASLCLLPICFFAGYFQKKYFTLKFLTMMVISGALIILNWVFLFSAFPKTSISLATIVYHVNPFIIMYLGVLFLHEKLTKSAIFWTVLAFLGLIIIIGLDRTTFSFDGLLGLGLVLFATTIYSISVLITKKIVEIPPLLIVFVQTLTGTVLMLPFALLKLDINGYQWFYLIGLGVFHTALLYFLMYSAIKKIPLNNVAILSFIYPISTVIFDYFFFNHLLTGTQILGGLLILLSVLGVKLNWTFNFKRSMG